MSGMDPTYGRWTGPVKPSGIRLEGKEDMLTLLNFAVREKLSDLFLQTGLPVMVTIHGEATGITTPLKKGTVENCLRWITNQDSVVARLQSGHDFDMAFSIDDQTERDEDGYALKHRFRVNLTANYFEGDTGYQAALRYIKQNPPTIKDVGLEPEIVRNIDAGKGKIIFVGATGSGKTSTIAAAIVFVMEGNTSIKGNILTYEAPIEFTFESVPSSCCFISQTEIGLHLESFAAGVRNSLRRKPSLLMIGELRDAETISASVEAANNGHPIFTTTHANSVDLTFKRLFEKFPAEQQSQSFYSLVATTNMIVAQRIVPRKKTDDEDPDYVCLREWMVIDNDVRVKLENAGPERHDKVIRDIFASKELGDNARSMAETVKRRWQENIIDTNVALAVMRDFGHRGITEADLRP